MKTELDRLRTQATTGGESWNWTDTSDALDLMDKQQAAIDRLEAELAELNWLYDDLMAENKSLLELAAEAKGGGP